MQHRQLAPLDAHLLDQGPFDGGPRWLIPALVAAAAASGALLFWAVGASGFALLFFAGFVAMLVALFVIERHTARIPDAPAVAVPDLPLVGATLALLSEEQRELLILTRFQQMKYEEVAELMETTVANIKVKVHRAIAKLREHYFELEKI